MKVKKFTGSDVKETMRMVRAELGEDAVILHTKKKKKPRIFGLFSKEEVEILAAIDDTKKEIPREMPKEDRVEHMGLDSRRTEERRVQELKKNINPEAIRRLQEETSSDELSEIKASIEYIAKKLKLEDINTKFSDYSTFLKTMIDNGVEEEVAKDILENVSSQVVLDGKTSGEVREIVRRNIKSYLGELSQLKYEGEKKTIFFIGPTGVGKTTTLAKLASHFVLNERCKVGLITADTYRIGAVDQLKIYGDILDIPVKAIYDINEIYDALSVFRDKDIVFIDTAGRSHKNKPQIEELKNLIDTVKNKEVYLLLNVGTEMKNISSIIDEYSFIDDYNIIFTKIDETEQIGNILNTRYYSNKKLSYVTTGQNVPDDIELVNLDKVSRILVGEEDDES